MSDNIATDFPFQSHTVDVFGSKMHYIDEGQGDVILFIHGVPTSSYLWRNIIPTMSTRARCIAVDLIGMGQSDKPDIAYRIFDHINYLEGFIEALGLKNVTLVMHAWGSVIGFDYAMRHQENIKALAFLEAHVRPATNWEMVALPVQELAVLRDSEDGGYDVLMNSNYYVNKVMPNGVLRRLTETEMQHYREPFAEPGSCRPIWQYLQDLPMGEGPEDVVELISNYSEALTQSEIPKLMLYAVPGFITTIDTVQWALNNLPNLTQVDIGEALHYAQESNPEKIASELFDWYGSLAEVTA